VVAGQAPPEHTWYTLLISMGRLGGITAALAWVPVLFRAEQFPDSGTLFSPLFVACLLILFEGYPSLRNSSRFGAPKEQPPLIEASRGSQGTI